VPIITSNNVEVSSLEIDFVKKGKVLSLVKDVETRWNSTFSMMHRIKQLRQPLEKYISLLQSSG
jgi:hypothetical protein